MRYKYPGMQVISFAWVMRAWWRNAIQSFAWLLRWPYVRGSIAARGGGHDAGSIFLWNRKSIHRHRLSGDGGCGNAAVPDTFRIRIIDAPLRGSQAAFVHENYLLSRSKNNRLSMRMDIPTTAYLVWCIINGEPIYDVFHDIIPSNIEFTQQIHTFFFIHLKWNAIPWHAR